MLQERHIGSKLQHLRESLNLSVAELAERSGCDATRIEQLECGAFAPSLAPLIKITRALGVRLGTLLDDDEQYGPVITRRDDAKPVTRFNSLGTTSTVGELDFFTLAANKTARHMEPFLVDVNPTTADDHTLSSHEGEEFMFILDGHIVVEYGKDQHLLQAGDSIYYDSIVPHQVRAQGNQPARILAVVYTPF